MCNKMLLPLLLAVAIFVRTGSAASAADAVPNYDGLPAGCQSGYDQVASMVQNGDCDDADMQPKLQAACRSTVEPDRGYAFDMDCAHASFLFDD